MQGTQVDPWPGKTPQSSQACAPQLLSHTWVQSAATIWAQVPQLMKAECLEHVLHNKRGRSRWRAPKAAPARPAREGPRWATKTQHGWTCKRWAALWILWLLANIQLCLTLAPFKDNVSFFSSQFYNLDFTFWFSAVLIWCTSICISITPRLKNFKLSAIITLKISSTLLFSCSLNSIIKYYIWSLAYLCLCDPNTSGTRDQFWKISFPDQDGGGLIWGWFKAHYIYCAYYF